MQFLIIPPRLVKSAQKARPFRTVWWVVAANGKRHKWRLDRSASISLDSFIEWVHFLSTEDGCPLNVEHRTLPPGDKLLASGVVLLTGKGGR